jgi:hypothetical protein
LLWPIYAQGAQRLEQILVDAQVRAFFLSLSIFTRKRFMLSSIWVVLTGFYGPVRPDLVISWLFFPWGFDKIKSLVMAGTGSG